MKRARTHSSCSPARLSSVDGTDARPMAKETSIVQLSNSSAAEGIKSPKWRQVRSAPASIMAGVTSGAPVPISIGTALVYTAHLTKQTSPACGDEFKAVAQNAKGRTSPAKPPKLRGQAKKERSTPMTPPRPWDHPHLWGRLAIRNQAICAMHQLPLPQGAIQSDAVTLRIFVMRVIGCHLRASRFWPRWPNRPPNRRFDG